VKNAYADVAGHYHTKYITSEKKEDKIARDHLNRRVKELSRQQKIKNVLEMGQTYLPLTEEWDRNPMLLCVKNGVIDLTTGKLTECRPEDYIRTVLL